MKKACFLGFLTVALLSTAFPARALATGAPDIMAGLRTLPLLTSKINGDVTMAVLYDPAVAGSQADAVNIVKIVEAGIKLPGGGKLSAIMISVDELGKLSMAQIAFLTPGLAAHYADINTATSAASILTITTDLGCVRAGKCVIGVETQPGINIYYSRIAADAAKLEFSNAFSMLVKEL